MNRIKIPVNIDRISMEIRKNWHACTMININADNFEADAYANEFCDQLYLICLKPSTCTEIHNFASDIINQNEKKKTINFKSNEANVIDVTEKQEDVLFKLALRSNYKIAYGRDRFKVPLLVV